ncbi:VOC family protein [Niveibacterium sp.]|uniref:VOC family protein n=1 Tax=Niveibacterium sp. TaxID=2017444 RepID=UPI0035B2D577
MNTTQTAVQKIPAGMHSLTPHLVCRNAADAIGFYERAFGAVTLGRLPGPDGKLMHAMLKIGDSALMLNDEFPEFGALGPQAGATSPVTIHLFVEDVDATFARAVEAGARVTMPVADMFWGDRYGKLEDPFGHQWSVATHIRDLTPEQIAAAMPQGCPDAQA